MRYTILLAPILVLSLTGCERLLSVKPQQLSDKPQLSWMTDFEEARMVSATEGKMVLLNFTGSDWCPACKRLDDEALSREAFAAFARGNLVLVEIDFPRNTEQLPQVAQANHELAEQYGVQEYPTLILLDSSGATLGRIEYQGGGARPLLGQISSVASAQPAKTASNGFKLQGISGRPGHRLALINNRTLGEGESISIKRGAEKVNVRCISINDDRVLVTVEGQADPAELRLSGRL